MPTGPQSRILLSGAWVSTDQSEIRVGRTMDQVLAERIGNRTAIPSLVLGIEPTELRLEDGLSMIYGSCISWASDTKPATKEIYPSRVFDLLVGDGHESRQLDRSILDQVLADAGDLRRQSQPRRPPQAGRVSEFDPRHRTADRPRRQTGGWKAGDRSSLGRTCRGPATSCRRTFRSTCG